MKKIGVVIAVSLIIILGSGLVSAGLLGDIWNKFFGGSETGGDGELATLEGDKCGMLLIKCSDGSSQTYNPETGGCECGGSGSTGGGTSSGGGGGGPVDPKDDRLLTGKTPPTDTEESKGILIRFFEIFGLGGGDGTKPSAPTTTSSGSAPESDYLPPKTSGSGGATTPSTTSSTTTNGIQQNSAGTLIPQYFVSSSGVTSTTTTPSTTGSGSVSEGYLPGTSGDYSDVGDPGGSSGGTSGGTGGGSSSGSTGSGGGSSGSSYGDANTPGKCYGTFYSIKACREYAWGIEFTSVVVDGCGNPIRPAQIITGFQLNICKDKTYTQYKCKSFGDVLLLNQQGTVPFDMKFSECNNCVNIRQNDWYGRGICASSTSPAYNGASYKCISNKGGNVNGVLSETGCVRDSDLKALAEMDCALKTGEFIPGQVQEIYELKDKKVNLQNPCGGTGDIDCSLCKNYQCPTGQTCHVSSAGPVCKFFNPGDNEYENCQAKGFCGDGICQDISCTAEGCPTPETPQNCPLDCGGNTNYCVTRNDCPISQTCFRDICVQKCTSEQLEDNCYTGFAGDQPACICTEDKVIEKGLVYELGSIDESSKTAKLTENEGAKFTLNGEPHTFTVNNIFGIGPAIIITAKLTSEPQILTFLGTGQEKRIDFDNDREDDLIIKAVRRIVSENRIEFNFASTRSVDGGDKCANHVVKWCPYTCDYTCELGSAICSYVDFPAGASLPECLGGQWFPAPTKCVEKGDRCVTDYEDDIAGIPIVDENPWLDPFQIPFGEPQEPETVDETGWFNWLNPFVKDEETCSGTKYNCLFGTAECCPNGVWVCPNSVTGESQCSLVVEDTGGTGGDTSQTSCGCSSDNDCPKGGNGIGFYCASNGICVAVKDGSGGGGGGSGGDDIICSQIVIEDECKKTEGCKPKYYYNIPNGDFERCLEKGVEVGEDGLCPNQDYYCRRFSIKCGEEFLTTVLTGLDKDCIINCGTCNKYGNENGVCDSGSCYYPEELCEVGGVGQSVTRNMKCGTLLMGVRGMEINCGTCSDSEYCYRPTPTNTKCCPIGETSC